MREKRKPLENYFVQKVMDYVHAEIDESATEIAGVTDKPDLAISSHGQIIGIELSQFPSSYIIENFHKPGPNSACDKNQIEGHLFIYPFEPHRWVHEVLKKKNKKVKAHKKRIGANQMWLVMHCHSSKREWPMSRTESKGNREAEAYLMRFGTKQYRSKFDQIFYIYADGTVVRLAGGKDPIPTAAMLPEGAGYPAVTTHQFAFNPDVPLPDQNPREYKFESIQFIETIIAPMDDWMADRYPDIHRPNFTLHARVTSDKMKINIFRDGVLIFDRDSDTRDSIGQILTWHFLLEWGVTKTTISFNF